MNLFETVKASVSVPEAARAYAIPNVSLFRETVKRESGSC